ncbi:hypothetical protein LTR13_007755 [Exophiala sideris]|nr:hypothetical protein LTR13_007755 [Exophiala sideris]
MSSATMSTGIEASRPQLTTMTINSDEGEYLPMLANVTDGHLGDDDTTDEEDWASIGPGALRARGHPAPLPPPPPPPSSPRRPWSYHLPPSKRARVVDDSDEETSSPPPPPPSPRRPWSYYLPSNKRARIADENLPEAEEEEEEEWEEEEEEEEEDLVLAKDIQKAPRPDDFVIDVEDEDEEEEQPQQASGKKRKRSANTKSTYIPNSTTPEDQQHFFKKCRLPKELAALSWAEKQQRLLRYELRLKFTLESLQASAKAISWDEIFTNAEDMGMTVAWWHFLINFRVKPVLPILLKGAPELVCLVLGGPLTREELLLLPQKWKGVGLLGVYVDGVTGKPLQTGDKMERYTGSATGAKGLEQRLADYPAVNKGTRKPDAGAHEALICQKGIEINLRVLAAFESSTPKPYVMLSELVHTILLQSWVDEAGRYMTQACIDIMREATPRDVPAKTWKGLNRASQMLQALRAPARNQTCSNCKRENLKRPYNAVIGVPFMSVVCHNCYEYPIRHKGATRPVSLEKAMASRKARPKPGDNLCECPGCDRPAKVMNYNLNLWTCISHIDCTTLPNLLMRLTKESRPKPADNKCERQGCDRDIVHFNYKLIIWTCKNCQGATKLVKTK